MVMCNAYMFVRPSLHISKYADTPLGIACGRFGNPSMILTLVSGGTHIDFCGKEGLLPIHRAAIGGNAKAIKVMCMYMLVVHCHLQYCSNITLHSFEKIKSSKIANTMGKALFLLIK